MQIFRFPTPCRAPDGAEGGTGQQDAQQQGGAGQDSAAGAEHEGGLFDQVDQDAPAPDQDGKPQRPAWCEEQFWDAEKGEVRFQELAKSRRDLRALIAKGEHKPPANADGYQVPKVEGVADAAALLGGRDDPLWRDVRTAAHAAGVSQAQMQALLAPVLAAVAKRGSDPAQPDPAAQAAQAEQIAEARRAELGRLGPNGAQLVRQTGAWLAGLQSRGVFTEAEVKALRSTTTTADAVRALAKLRELSGEQGIPMDALAAPGEMSQADAEKLLVAGLAKGDEKMAAKGRAALAALDKRGLLRAS